MSAFLKPAVSLSNALRFKAKFILLASVFLLPIFIGSWWIVQEQSSLITQHQQELLGLQHIQRTITLEKTSLVNSTFSEVTNNVDEIVGATSQISTAVNQQEAMVKEMVQNTDNIAQGADQVMQAAKDAASAGGRLLELADHLSQQLAQFKLHR